MTTSIATIEAKWSKLPPRKAGVYHFRGVRLTNNNQTMRFDEPVRVQQMKVGYRTSLGVAMLGKARIYTLNSFHGEWCLLNTEAA